MIQIPVLLLLISLVHAALAGYTLQDDFNGSNFFDSFSFFSGADPSHGTVQYQSQANATAQGLAYVRNNRIVMRADNTTVTPKGRPSVRVYSNQRFNYGLFVFDLNHMPAGCGTWPAYWMVGASYKESGEIDILEGVNLQSANGFSLHTDTNCTMEGAKQVMTGKSSNTNSCNIHTGPGCGIEDTRVGSFGDPFNKNGGGVYVTRWESATGIEMWFFPRGHVPSDLDNNQPMPETWGSPTADYPFGNNCDPLTFKDLRIIINLTFCGSWAGDITNYSGYKCPSTCESHVVNTPSAFSEAYWDINSLKVYRQQ